MGNPTHVQRILKDGATIWNLWRREETATRPDLSDTVFTAADLREVDLSDADLSGATLLVADLSRARMRAACLTGANCTLANLSGADLSGADLSDAHLSRADLRGADLRGADLRRADLSRADLTAADLTGANLSSALCVGTDFSRATLTGCVVYGTSVWGANLDGAVQTNLRFMPAGETSLITVDNVEVAQFLHLLLRDGKASVVLDAVTSKVALVVGHWSARRPVVDTLRTVLSDHPNQYVPVLIDVGQIEGEPLTETALALARLARFVIADLTDTSLTEAGLSALSAGDELVPIQPLIVGDVATPNGYTQPHSRATLLPIHRFENFRHLASNLADSIIAPIERLVHARALPAVQCDAG